jgi:hypothetical protein
MISQHSNHHKNAEIGVQCVSVKVGSHTHLQSGGCIDYDPNTLMCNTSAIQFDFTEWTRKAAKGKTKCRLIPLTKFRNEGGVESKIGYQSDRSKEHSTAKFAIKGPRWIPPGQPVNESDVNVGRTSARRIVFEINLPLTTNSWGILTPAAIKYAPNQKRFT